ncbi:hypothetical protein [Thermoactinomyces mirandus]|uniref:Protein kinase domain-containing protein n=1 Tax=Thermoactinomyces mirandus TaxID=2756294 RepID=A0A7W1XPY5_9BACL|nr:hypothetical protein [Thermoactinomyces mirandus]MBA4600880.1 hypothetical protein [Thermoactinomyces mirandus]
MKQGNRLNRRYYERFQVEDVINFYSGQLLQAKSPDGAQVFLQSIKITRRPLPSGYRETFRRLQHPNLAPILDVIEEKDQIILVHPPFSGDPLPLIVNKDRAMEPEAAVRIVNRCFKTLHDLGRQAVPLGATLDPKNILLDGQKPLLLFYYMKDPEKPRYDEKWRELLFYLLTGHSPTGGAKRAEKVLGEKKVPQKVAKLALTALDRKRTFNDISRLIGKHIKEHSGEVGPRGRRKKSGRKKVYAIATVAAAALVLVSLAAAQWEPENSYSSTNPLTGLMAADENKKEQAKQQNQTIRFSKAKDKYTLPYEYAGNNTLSGEIVLKGKNTFLGYLESVDKSAIYGLYIDEKGEIGLFHQLDGGKIITTAKSGDQYRMKPNKKYLFQIHYLTGNPVRISIQEEGKKESWMAVGITPLHGEMKVHFRGGDGSILYNPKINSLLDPGAVIRKWMNQQPWIIDYGQAILSSNDKGQMSLEAFPDAQIRLEANAASGFMVQPFSDKPFAMDIQTLGIIRYRLVLSGEDKHVVLYDLDGQMKKVAEHDFPQYDGKKPVQISITSNMNTLNIYLGYGTDSIELNHTAREPILIKDVTLHHDKGFKLSQGGDIKESPLITKEDQ